MACCPMARSHYLKQCWLIIREFLWLSPEDIPEENTQEITHWNGFEYYLLSSLWPNDAICQHRSGSTLAQVMAWCLMASSHYLSQCWLFISEVQWHPSEGNSSWDASAVSHENKLEGIYLKFCSNISGANELRASKHCNQPSHIRITLCSYRWVPDCDGIILIWPIPNCG